MSVAEIIEILEMGWLKNRYDAERLVPLMLRGVCKDEHVDAVEEFIRQFESIDWGHKETKKALQPDEHYVLAQKIADVITPILMKYDLSLPASQNPDYMRDDLAFALASFMKGV